MSSRLGKYLRTRALNAPWQLSGCTRAEFHAAVIIPALAESDSLSETLASLARNPPEDLARTLIVLVVNNRADATPVEKADNKQTLEWLKSNPVPTLNLAWVDACSTDLELPVKEGVGLARRIGCDLVLERLCWTQDPLLISLDADSLVAENYLSAIFAHFEIHACAGTYLPFCHQPAEDAKQEAAIREYELYLRSYLLGLQWAGSPYAFTAIGSALACRADSYIAAGGMPRRLAGEDFYFLQQLVKVGGVTALEGTLVRPASRISTRVPFGTGRVVQARLGRRAERLYGFVSAASFRLLRDWLRLVEKNADSPPAEILRQADELSGVLGQFLRELNFVESWEKLWKNNRQAQFLPAWNNWFDGLRTRQLLLRLVQQQVEMAPAEQVEELLEAAGWPDLRDIPAQLYQLEQLQGCCGAERER